MTFLFIPVLILIAVALVGCSLFLASNAIAGANLVIVTYLVGVITVNALTIPLALQIYPADLAFVLLLMAVVLRYAMGRFRPRGVLWIPVCLFLLFAFSLARGFAAYGIKLAGVESRGWFYYLAGLLYFSSFNITPRIRKSLTTTWLVASLVLSGIAVFRWLATLADLSIVAQWQPLLIGGELRVLSANDASFLAVGFFASVFLNTLKTGPYWQRKVFYLLGPVLLLLQHRTVWVMMIIGLLWLGLQDARFRKKVIGGVAGMAVVGVVLAVFLFSHQSEVVAASLKNSASNDDTLLWRVGGWYQLLFNNPARNGLNDTIGEPFGTGFERIVAGERVDVAPHNFYVEAFLRIGFVGLCLLVWLYAKGIRRLKRMPQPFRRFIYPGTRFWALVLLMQLVFFFTYAAPFEQSILTGIALTGLRLRIRERTTLQLEGSAPPAPA